jgi:anti-sigma-K factor RskA
VPDSPVGASVQAPAVSPITRFQSYFPAVPPPVSWIQNSSGRSALISIPASPLATSTGDWPTIIPWRLISAAMAVIAAALRI